MSIIFNWIIIYGLNSIENQYLVFVKKKLVPHKNILIKHIKASIILDMINHFTLPYKVNKIKILKKIRYIKFNFLSDNQLNKI